MYEAKAPPAPHRLFGRRKGRPLRNKKALLIRDLLPRLAIDMEGPLTEEPIDPRKFFEPRPEGVWLEIGFGGGEHLSALAERHSAIGFIGCEPFVNGVASLLQHIDEKSLTNIRILPGDARTLIDRLKPASIARAFLLFPDPWPKARHVERRFIQAENCKRLATILAPGAELRAATDDPQLKIWILSVLKGTPEFELLFASEDAPQDWVPTRYEQKSLTAGRRPLYMGWRRKKTA